MNPIDSIEATDLKKGLPRLAPGDTVRVHVRVKETSVKEEIKGNRRRRSASASRSSKVSSSGCAAPAPGPR
jgi:ribosomal protein L19